MTPAIKIIEHYRSILEQSGPDVISSLGESKQQAGPDMQILKPNAPLFNTIIVNKKGNSVSSISFGGADFKVLYTEILDHYGSISTRYNWRDNYTGFFVDFENAGTIKRMNFTIDGKVQVNNGDYKYENDSESSFTSEIGRLFFNNFTFEFQ